MDELVKNIKLLIENKETLMSTIISSVITMFVALVGFSLNIYLNKRSLINEMNKYKSNKQLDKLQEVPEEILECIDLISVENYKRSDILNEEVFHKKIENIIKIITSYGSQDSVKLAGELHQVIIRLRRKYRRYSNVTLDSDETVKLIVYLTLLLCQLKLDLTNQIMKPFLYYRCRMNESSPKFYGTYNQMMVMNNYIIKYLKLNRSFKLKYKDMYTIPDIEVKRTKEDKSKVKVLIKPHNIIKKKYI